jgi:hypothetical protein
MGICGIRSRMGAAIGSGPVLGRRRKPAEVVIRLHPPLEVGKLAGNFSLKSKVREILGRVESFSAHNIALRSFDLYIGIGFNFVFAFEPPEFLGANDQRILIADENIAPNRKFSSEEVVFPESAKTRVRGCPSES